MAGNLPGHPRNRTLIAIVVIAALATIGVCLVLPITNRWWFAALFLPLVLIVNHHQNSIDKRWKGLFFGFMLGLLIIFVFAYIRVMLSNVSTPPEWDLQWFWLHARVASQGLNFYEPQHAMYLAQQFNASVELQNELYFWYPPLTMLWIMPMGWFDIQTGCLVWYLVLSMFLIIDIGLLWRIFQRGSGWLGILITATAVLMLRSTASTIGMGQTNFLVLFLLLLFWNNRLRWQGGIWLALGIIAKPFVAVLLIYVVLRRHWPILISALITLVLLSLLALAVFGVTTFISYFTLNPTDRMPTYLYTEMVNQSMLATILRLTRAEFETGTVLLHPLYLIVGFALLAISLWLVYSLPTSQTHWGLMVTLAVALLLYPATLEHYSILLIASLLLMWAYREIFPKGVASVIVFITTEYALIGYGNGSYVFFAVLLNWLALVAICIWILRQRSLPALGWRVSRE